MRQDSKARRFHCCCSESFYAKIGADFLAETFHVAPNPGREREGAHRLVEFGAQFDCKFAALASLADHVS